MSGSAIADALVNILTAASVYGPSMVSHGTYDVLANSSGSCAVVHVTGEQSTPGGFGPSWQDTITLTVENYSRDTGDSDALKKRLYSMTKNVHAAVRANPTLDATCDGVFGLQTSRGSTERAIDVGGQIWIATTTTIMCRDLDPT